MALIPFSVLMTNVYQLTVTFLSSSWVKTVHTNMYYPKTSANKLYILGKSMCWLRKKKKKKKKLAPQHHYSFLLEPNHILILTVPFHKFAHFMKCQIYMMQWIKWMPFKNLETGCHILFPAIRISYKNHTVDLTHANEMIYMSWDIKSSGKLRWRTKVFSKCTLNFLFYHTTSWCIIKWKV